VTLQPSTEFDPIKDFDPIMLVATAQDVLLVPPNSPFHSVKELIDYAKAHPGELNYASLGTGTSGHLATVMFSELAGIKLQHVPYTSVSQATTDVISGRIAVFLPTLGGHLGNVAAGRMRALAVSGTTRATQLPDVPTFNELGVKFVDETSWYALFAPKGTRKEIIAKINAELERILALPDVREKGVTLGYCPHASRRKEQTCGCRKRRPRRLPVSRPVLYRELCNENVWGVARLRLAMPGGKLNSPPRARRECGCRRRRRTPSASLGSSWPTCAANLRPRSGRAP